MISFKNNYLKNTHKKILKQLINTNLIQTSKYNFDQFTTQTIKKIKNTINYPNTTIHFLINKTQTNQIIINSILKNYKKIISTNTNHITIHKNNTIKYNKHKIITIPSKKKKINTSNIKTYIKTFKNNFKKNHIIFPKIIYISHPTKYNTLYSKSKLKKLYKIYKQYQLPLFINNTQLKYKLINNQSNITIKNITKYYNIFYINNTKINTLYKKTIIFTKNNKPKQFTTQIKHHNTLLTKKQLTNIQFLKLFTNNLYFNINKHTIKITNKIKNKFKNKNYHLYFNSPTNQQFFILNNKKITKLKQKIKFTI